MINKKKILISCINSHSYGGASYWENFVKNFVKISKKSQNRYFFLVNQNSKISKLINKKNRIIVKNYIHKNIFLRFLCEQIFVPLFIFRKFKIKYFFNGKNIAPFLIKKKSIIVIQNMEPFYYYKLSFSKRKILLYFMYLLSVISLKNCYKIISVSNNTTNIIKKFTKNKIFVIPNGAYVSKKYKNKWSKYNTKNYILNSSKFVPYANQLKLLKIYKEANSRVKNLPNLHFAGDILDKEYFNEILRFIINNKLDKKIKFLGYLSKNKLHDQMKNCKLFVFSSELESCPQTILEARLVGCPILSNDAQPMPEFIEKEGEYFKIDKLKESVDILINSIYKINYKKSLKKKLEEYNWENVILKYFDILNNHEK